MSDWISCAQTNIAHFFKVLSTWAQDDFSTSGATRGDLKTLVSWLRPAAALGASGRQAASGCKSPPRVLLARHLEQT
eukprot:762975-Hanusia_phi.AAC.3